MPPKRNQRGPGGDDQGDDAPGGSGRRYAKKAATVQGGGRRSLMPKIVDYAANSGTNNSGDGGSLCSVVPGDEPSDENQANKGKSPLQPTRRDAAAQSTPSGQRKTESKESKSSREGGSPCSVVTGVEPSEETQSKSKSKNALQPPGSAAAHGARQKQAISERDAAAEASPSGQRKSKTNNKKSVQDTGCKINGKKARTDSKMDAAAEASPSGQSNSQRSSKKPPRNSGRAVASEAASSGDLHLKRKGKKGQEAAISCNSQGKGKKATQVVGSPVEDPLQEDNAAEKITLPYTRATEANAGASGGKLRKKARRLQQSAANVKSCDEADDHSYLVLSEHADEVEGNQTMPKKVNKAKKEKKVARRQQKAKEEIEFEENILLTQLTNEVLFVYLWHQLLIADCSIQNLASGSASGPPDPPKDQDNQSGDGELLGSSESHIQDPKIIALRLCQSFESQVKMFTHNTAKQLVIDDNPVFTPIHLTSVPTPEDVLRFSDESIDLFLKVCTFSIPIEINGVTQEVPVTKAKPIDFEYTTYHVVVLTRPSDEAQIHFLIEQYSSYMGAFKVVLKHEDPNTKPWLILGLRNILPSFFKKVQHIRADERHGDLDKVKLHRDIFSQIFNYWIRYNVKHPEDVVATPEEEVLHTTTMVVTCEVNRFSVIKMLLVEGVTREVDNYLRFPWAYPILVKDWSNLSKLIFCLYLALLEKPKLAALPRRQRKASPFFKTMTKTRRMWRSRQEALKASISFFIEDQCKDMKLEWLCGSHITLMRHDPGMCDKLLMRLNGYFGHWLKDIQPSFERQDSSDEDRSANGGSGDDSDEDASDEDSSANGGSGDDSDEDAAYLSGEDVVDGCGKELEDYSRDEDGEDLSVEDWLG